MNGLTITSLHQCAVYAGYDIEKGYGLSTSNYVVIYLYVIIIMFPFEKKNKREFEKVDFSHLLYMRKQYGLC